MKTAVFIIVYSIVNALIISNGGDNFWAGWYMGLSVIFVYRTLDIISERKAKHDKYKDWADKLNRGEKL
ncbi:hypothetical protein DQM11_08225 [Leuconostoc pseudomesenteroides]|jgi:intracellular septation protein A|uniref:Uncharacterized protein n=1 Tax=Leuconostoc falkenbergense TaxID=2766470 RepID=A0ABT7RZ92_9LACO|nr:MULTISPECIES: hypothetical protein [Leuconostoc]RDG17940.1 hypothetical protein DQM11_08225 [Leuconostoc pseudomesenteroides]MCT3038363.1 hypothetical protein [Leuconostoc mesenteroides]MDM7646627.1 hypothetical protein [Leuconostoc falkenbergense]MDV3545903.1 hypothetical protein [Leuconostoc falkenbergense]VTU69087.1 hypothetical protein AMBR_MGDJBKAP_01142 [Leuconostoc pseudomesenteroides]